MSLAYAFAFAATIALPDLKEQCAELLANSRIVAPKTTLDCEGARYEWRALPHGRAGEVRGVERTETGATLRIPAFAVPLSVRASERPISLPVCYAEQWKVVLPPLERLVPCEDVLRLESIHDECATALAAAAAAAPAGVFQFQTGEVLDTCR